MSIPYKINPVRATCMKAEGTDFGMQAANDTCYGICAAYSQNSDLWQADPQCIKACDDYINEKRIEIYGVGQCDHQTPFHPVIWDQVPRYVPYLLKNGREPGQAMGECMQLCDKFVPMLKEECRDKCIIDFNAIEPYEETKAAAPKPLIPKIVDRKTGQPVPVKSSSSSYETTVIIPVIIVGIAILLILFFLFSRG